MARATHSPVAGKVAGILNSPFVGISPWIAFSLLVGPGRFEWAVALALVISLTLVVGGGWSPAARRGSSWNCPTWCSSGS